jgi:hypothetical protein
MPAAEGMINGTEDGGRQGIGCAKRLQRRDARGATIAPVGAAVHQVPNVGNR